MSDARNRLHAQEDWVAEHGGTEEAYVKRYGSIADEHHYGNGGEAIFAADQAALDMARAEVEAEEARRART
jgi:hypothetical protein